MQTILDVQPLVLWVGAMSLVLSFGATIWTLFSSPARRAETHIADMTKRMDGVELRSQRIEDQLAQMPTRDMLHRLELSMTRMEGHFFQIEERLKPVAAIADNMMQWMLENGK